MKHNLAVKERRFLEAYLDGKTLAECAKYAGSKAKDNNSLKVIGHQMLTRLNLTLDETFDLKGLSDELMAQKIKEGLEAERVHFATFEGKFTDERKTPDVPTRLKATELLGKFRGYLIEKHEVKTDGEITFSITPATPAQRKGPTRIEMDGWQSGEEK